MTDSVKRGYRTAEAAEYLGVSVVKLRELIASKQIGHKRIGTLISIPKEELDDYYNSLGN